MLNDSNKDGIVLVEGIIKTSYLVSVNSMYEPNLRYHDIGKFKFSKVRYCTYHGLRLSNDAVRLKQTITTELEKSKLVLDKSKINWNKIFSFTIVFVLDSGIMRRDTANMEKCTTDAIFNYFGLNDNRNFAMHLYKVFNTCKGEYVKFKLTQPNVKIEDLRI